MEDAPVHIVEYDTSWPTQFEREQALLAGALAQWIIDIMVPVDSLAASRDALSAAESLGYLYAPYRADVMHWFCKPSPSFRTHHLHLVPFGSALWTEKLAFRDHLRRHPPIAAEYAELKRRLAKVHAFDREAYTEAKGPFIQRVLEMAMAKRAARERD